MKKKDIEWKREFDIPTKHQFRWKGVRGVVWFFLSLKVRLRDAKKYGTCVACSKPLKWDEGFGGHYIAVARAPGLLSIDEKNVHLECNRCNNPSWVPDSSIPFGAELNKRYGKGFAEKLYERSKKSEPLPSELQLVRIAWKLKKEVKEFEIAQEL